MARWERALVTGASSGIGREMCRQLAADGTALVVVARSEERLHELSAELSVDVEVLPADLTDRVATERVAARVGGGPDIDLVVNNAGFGNRGPLAERDAADVMSEIDVNCRALLALTHAAVRVMVPRGRGGVLNVSSVAGFQPSPGASLYAATKSFVTCFSQGVHEEVRGSGVHVSVLAPGLTRTEFQDRGGWEISSMMELAWQDADEVAKAGLSGVARNRAVVVPGVQNKVMVGSTRLLPDAVTRRIVGIATRNQ